ncbi:MAG: hypothetical protein IT384_11425 [Deltaproteobacteria bacterium]|nr:hypothetical protein [Deltaproteobacteria bacterium]
MGAITAALLSVTGIERRFVEVQRVAAEGRATRLAKLHRDPSPCRRWVDRARLGAGTLDAARGAIVSAGFAHRSEAALLLFWSWSQADEVRLHERGERDEVLEDLRAQLTVIDRFWLGRVGRAHLEAAADAAATLPIRVEADIRGVFDPEEEAKLRALWAEHPLALSPAGIGPLLSLLNARSATVSATPDPQ